MTPKATRRVRATAPATDRRSLTSRANLEPYIPKPLSADGSRSVCARVPTVIARKVDRAARAAGMTRSDWLRKVITEALT